MYAEFHTHLGGSTLPQTLFSIAYDRGLKIKKYQDYEKFSDVILNGTSDDKSLVGYLDRYKMIHEICSYPQSIELSVFHVLEDLYINHGYRLVELKLNPAMRNQNGLYDLDTMIMSACNGLQKAKAIFKDLRCGLIIESDQSFSVDLTKIIFEKAVKFKNFGVVGVDISGYYSDFSNNLRGGFYEEAFRYIKENGLKTTLHFGETLSDVPDESDRNSLYNFKSIIKNIDRIGHGVQFLLYSKFAIDMIASHGVPLEFCPNSNLKTGTIEHEDIEKILSKARCNNIEILLCTDGHVFNGNFENNLKTIQNSVKDIRLFNYFKDSVSDFNRISKFSFINQ